MIKNKCKKIVSAILIMAMIATMFSVDVFADDYEYEGKCGKKVMYLFNEETGELVIWGEGNCTKFPWLEYEDKIKTVTIKDGITVIDYFQFKDHESLTKITIPDSVTEIGFNAFSGCTSLESVTIGNGVTSIDEDAFEGCTSLQEINIPDSVTEISFNAFDGCTNLESVTIGNGVTSIGKNAFDGCTSLTSIIIDEGNSSYKSIDGVLFSKDGTKLYIYPEGKSETDYIIPDGVISIDFQTFYERTSLTSITIPNSVKKIGYGAFSRCTNLESVTIGNGVTYIDKYAFEGCTSLQEINIPDSVTEIDEDAFKECKNLIKVTIGKGITKIGNGAFAKCTSLASITICNHYTEIHKGAFYSCDSLKDVIYPGKTKPNWSDIFEYPYNNEVYNNWYGIRVQTSYDDTPESGGCGNGVTYSFDKSTGELKITGRGQMTDYLYWPKCSRVSPWYEYQDEIKSVTINDGITNIGNGAFYNCENLTSVKMPPVLSIGNFAFSGCTRLTSIKIPNGVRSIGESAFWGCKRLSSVTIPDSINFIDHHAFACCTSLNSVVYYGETQPQIGKFRLRHPVFVDCPQLKKVNVTSSYKGNSFCENKVIKGKI